MNKFELAKFSDAQLKKLAEDEIGKLLIEEYNDVKKQSKNFTRGYEALKEIDAGFANEIRDIVGPGEKKESTKADKDSDAQKKKEADKKAKEEADKKKKESKAEKIKKEKALITKAVKRLKASMSGKEILKEANELFKKDVNYDEDQPIEYVPNGMLLIIEDLHEKELTEMAQDEIYDFIVEVYNEITTKAPTKVELSWKKNATISQLQLHGDVYEIAVIKGTASRIAVKLKEDTAVLSKGYSKPGKALKGEFVVFVLVDKEKGQYRQYNIVENPTDKFVKIAHYNKDGSSELTEKGKAELTVAPPTPRKAKAKEKEASQAPKDEKMPPENEKGERLIDPASLKRLDEYLKKAKSTKAMHTVDGKYTAERRKLHEKILKDFTDNLACVKRDNPVAVFMGGPPGAGKSTYTRKHAKWLSKKEIFHIDADEVRSKLPEYEGWNAAITHAEVRDIMKGYDGFKGFFPHLGKNGCSFDVLYDGTMSSSKKFKTMVPALKKAGYKIYIIYVQVDRKTSFERSNGRFKNGGKKGRYVPQFVINEVHDSGLDAFNEVKKNVDGYVRVDGVTQNIVEKGGSDIPKDRNYKELTNGEVKKETKERTVKPEQYANKADSNKALATMIHTAGMNAKVGNADKVVSAVMRRKDDDRVIVQLNDLNYTKDGMKAVPGTEEYKLFQEKSGGLQKTSKPDLKDVVILDAKKEIFPEKGEGEGKTRGHILDEIYSKQEDIQKCFEIEKELHKCRQSKDGCTVEQQAYYKKMIKECTMRAGIKGHVKMLESLFEDVFSQQKPGEDFWEAYSRVMLSYNKKKK